MQQNKKSNFIKVIGTAVKFSVFALIVISGMNTLAAGQASDFKVYERERRLLLDKFGIALPNNFEQFQKYKLKKGVTYLLIMMSTPDTRTFISATRDAPSPKGVLSSIEDPECQKNPECPRIGSVFTPSDVPEKANRLKGWENFKSDTIGSFRLIKNNRYSRYASFFFDTERGLLALWYKT